MNSADDFDLLVHRAVNGTLDGHGWTLLEERALRAPEIWRHRALTWRDQADLEAGLQAVARALPLPPPGAARDSTRHARRLLPWSGWMVAAGLLLVWAARPGPTPATAPPPEAAAALPATTAAGGDAALDPERALALYRNAGRRTGRLVREYPLVLVEQRPAPGGQGTELLYLRRLLEREVVDGIYEYRPDDSGRPVAVPVRQAFHNTQQRL